MKPRSKKTRKELIEEIKGLESHIAFIERILEEKHQDYIGVVEINLKQAEKLQDARVNCVWLRLVYKNIRAAACDKKNRVLKTTDSNLYVQAMDDIIHLIDREEKEYLKKKLGGIDPLPV